jgi:putative peptidoglycan lipid II flippase
MLRAQIVRVVLGSGAFDWQATINTANALAFFSLSLFAQSLIHLLARAFYALSNSFIPFISGIIAELVSIIVALVLIKPSLGMYDATRWFHGVTGLAFASSVGIILNAVILFIALRVKTGNLEDQKLIRVVYKIILAGLGMAVGIQLLKYPLSTMVNMDRFWGILLHGFVSGFIGLLIYVVICYILKVEELLHVAQSLRKRWLKITNLPSTLTIEEDHL